MSYIGINQSQLEALNMLKTNLIAIMAILSFLSACSSTETIRVGNSKVDIPTWVKDPESMPKEEGIFYGVGSAKIDNADMSRNEADQLARRDVISNVEQRNNISDDIKNMHRNGKHSTKSENKIHFKKVGIQRGIRIIKRFVSDDGTWHSLAKLDTNRTDSSYESELNQVEIKAN